ncbi:hypothetical protein [Umezawaea tangerina]|uniref:Uncharacterized protein n=1 Tax=Umezawaea tangerina TaxID=84725 RepID=A0A2T0SPJ1_9PSEU|nr:hypothetical protein [Umezawaea tangerina]PRY35342.1 hypothetical protein CLV43_114260 [Umezawaea tangerina]
MAARRVRVRGNWTAPQVHGRSSNLLMVLFCATALVRALDYATGVDGVAATPNSALGAVERAFPLGVWSAALAFGAGLVLTGMTGRWPRLVIGGSLLLAVVYFGLTAGLLFEYLGRPALDGIRGATGLTAPVAWHMIVATHAITVRRALARRIGGSHGAG